MIRGVLELTEPGGWPLVSPVIEVEFDDTTPVFVADGAAHTLDAGSEGAPAAVTVVRREGVWRHSDGDVDELEPSIESRRAHRRPVTASERPP